MSTAKSYSACKKGKQRETGVSVWIILNRRMSEDKNSNNNNCNSCVDSDSKEDDSYIMGGELYTGIEDAYYVLKSQLSFELCGITLTPQSFSLYDPKTYNSHIFRHKHCSNNCIDNQTHENNSNNETKNNEDLNELNKEKTNIINEEECEYRGVFTSQEIEGKVDKVDSNVCILDHEGIIIWTNKSWKQFSNSNGTQDCKTTDTGVNYLRVCRGAAFAAKDDVIRGNAMAFYEGLSRLLDAETTEEFTLIYPCDSPAEKRWYLARAFTFHISEALQRTVISHQYISNNEKDDQDKKKLEKHNKNICNSNGNENHKSQDCEKKSGKRTNEDFGNEQNTKLRKIEEQTCSDSISLENIVNSNTENRGVEKKEDDNNDDCKSNE